MNCTIYMHRNKIDGKVYIGYTTQKNLNDRWVNGHGYKDNDYFTNAIKKYGWENFDHIILDSGDWDVETISKKEDYYIELYNARNREKGYNIKKGGFHAISPNALPAALAWRKQHPEYGLAHAAAMLKWQEEHPEEILAMRRINAAKATEARKKKVQCIETGIIYESASEAARQVPGTNQSKICMVCRGQRKTCGNLHWQYVYDEENLSDLELDNE